MSQAAQDLFSPAARDATAARGAAAAGDASGAESSSVVHVQPAIRAPWYAVRTRSNHERVAVERLIAKGVEAYLPTLLERSRRRDRRAVVSRPLFPGYFFARFQLDHADRVTVLQAPGVMHLVGFAGGPVAVPDWQVDSVRIALESKNRAEVLFKVVPGQTVQVIAGALAGARGVVLKTRGADRLVISIELLGRALAVDLVSHQVAPEGEGLRLP